MKNTNLSLKTTCITMSAIYHQKRKPFKAEIDAIRRKDYAFHRVLEANKNKVQKNRGKPC
jgi:hypothetical protein